MSLLTATWQVSAEDDSDKFYRYKDILNARAADGEPYDYIIIDNPPDLSINVVNAIAIADDIIIPVKIDKWALEGLDTILGQMEDVKSINNKVNYMGALITMYKNDDVNNSGIEWLKDNHYQLFDTTIRYSPKVPQNTFYNTSIEEYSKRSAAAVSYRRFVKEYLERIGQDE